jgi:hypothetical protein
MRATGKAAPGREAAPVFQPDHLDEAGRDRRPHDCRGDSRRRQPQHQAARLVARNRLDQPRDRGHADDLRISESDEKLPKGFGPPQGARAEVLFGDDRDVDQSDLGRGAVDVHPQPFVGLDRHVPGNGAAHGEAGRKTRDGRFAIFGKGVVGAGRNSGDGNGAAFRRHRAMRAVAAQHDDRGCAVAGQFSRGQAGILDRAGDGRVEEGQAWKTGLAAIGGLREMAQHMAADAAALGHHHGLRHAAGGKAGQRAQQHIGAIGDLKAVGLGDDAADVAPRNRIGDDADLERHGFPQAFFLEDVQQARRQRRAAP